MCRPDEIVLNAEPPKEGAAAKPQLPTFTRAQVEQEISAGRMLLVYNGTVLDVTKFAKYHPGGTLVMEHALHKDASDLIRVFHPDYVLEKKIPHYVIGTLQGKGDSASTDEATIDCQVTKDFALLYKQVEAKGWFETDAKFYCFLFLRLAVLFATFFLMVLFGSKRWWNYLLSAIINSIYWHQSAFVGHDLGHSGVTQTRAYDCALGILLGNVLGGISIGWWKSSHYVHHVVTNHPEHDPDIQHLPVFAVSKRFFDNVFSTYHQRILKFDAAAAVLVSIQHILYYPIMAVGRFNLYAQSFLFVLNKNRQVMWRPAEIAGLLFFWAWYSFMLSYIPTWKLRALYVLTSHIASGFLHLQITLSHFSMSTEEVGDDEPFAAHQLRTTMDVDCPEWLDWFHGGLQFQVEHHLFPRMPRHNLRLLMPLVKDFCTKHNLPYHSHGFVRCNALVLGSLKDMANQISVVMQSADFGTKMD